MTRSQFATAHKELDLVFGTEFRRVTAEQAQLLCEDVLALADHERVSLVRAAAILYRRVYAGNLAAYAASLVAGARRRQAEGRVARATRTSINGVERAWPEHVKTLFVDKVIVPYTPADGERVSEANYFTPRPWVDEYNTGSSKAGFVYTLQPGNRVCFVDWQQTFNDTPAEERYR